MLTIAIVSSLQMLLVMGILQAALPASITGTIYGAGASQLPCYAEFELDGFCPTPACGGPPVSCPRVINCTVPASNCSALAGAAGNCTVPRSNCTAIACPSQGPASIWKAIWYHPFLLMNGVGNLLYYFGETMLYREPLGLIFIVTASLGSTFLVTPFSIAFRLVARAPPHALQRPVPPLQPYSLSRATALLPAQASRPPCWSLASWAHSSA